MLRKTLILLVIGLLSQFCKDEKVSPDQLITFPMTIGSEWIYDIDRISLWYASDSTDQVVKIDTVKSSIRVLIAKDTVLRDSIAVKEFVTSEVGSQLILKQYYKLDNEGLKAYAYQDDGPVILASQYRNEVIGNLDYGTLGLDQSININKSAGGLNFFNQPRLYLKLPLAIGDEWTYILPTDIKKLQLDKEVVGYERLMLSTGTFDCYKVKNKHLNSEALEGIEWIDWFSPQGLIKRQTIYERVSLIYSKDESIGSIQIIENITIKELKIK